MKPLENEAYLMDAFCTYVTNRITAGEVTKNILYYDTSDKVN